MLVIYSSKQKVVHDYTDGRPHEECHVDLIEKKERRVFDLLGHDVYVWAAKHRFGLCNVCLGR